MLNDLRNEGKIISADGNVHREQQYKTAEYHEDQDEGTENLATIMAFIQPTLDASLTEGTKQKKSSLLLYWGIIVLHLALTRKVSETTQLDPTK